MAGCEFRISDTFTQSLGKLTADEQKLTKTVAFDLQLDPSRPGHSFHKLDRAKDKNFWSVRVGRDVRLIVHKTDASLLLCYVDHHDPAYHWAERRKIERHPTTGAAQLVEIRETVKEITVPKYVEVELEKPAKPPLFADTPDDELLGYGVPSEWLSDVKAANEDDLCELADHLPSEAAEALLSLAVGGAPEPATVSTDDVDPFDHPDAKRRFRIMADADELAQALDYPWEKWAVFLHPSQRSIVEAKFNGPARVSGSAGTGKTVVALHRAVFLAEQQEDARILVTTFSNTLARFLEAKLRHLVGHKPKVFERIEVRSIFQIARQLYERRFGTADLVTLEQLQQIITEELAASTVSGFTESFVQMEWREIVDAWQIQSLEEYLKIQRLGRKTRLPAKRRAELWQVLERIQVRLGDESLLTQSMIYQRVTGALSASGGGTFEFAVLDEAQDIGVAELRFVAALGGRRPDSLFFAGDLGQRIFQPPFSWKSLGIDIRGRSKTLKINYRTSHQIRQTADKLLGPDLADVDGNKESRVGTVSAFNGVEPIIRVYETFDQEAESISRWLRNLNGREVLPHEIAVFVRTSDEISRATSAIAGAGLDPVELEQSLEPIRGKVAAMTMHNAKGLEFRAVCVMACDDEIIPLNERMISVGDTADLEEVYNTERHLLYVACTRARDFLMVTGVNPASEFLDDMAEISTS